MTAGNPVADSKPDESRLCLLIFRDGHEVVGVWTGQKWIAAGRQVFPDAWAPLPNLKTRSTDNGK